MLPSWQSPFGRLTSAHLSVPHYPTGAFGLLRWLSWPWRSGVPQTCSWTPFSLCMNAICTPMTSKPIFSSDPFLEPHTHISIAYLIFSFLTFNRNFNLNIKNRALIFYASPASVNGTNYSLNCQVKNLWSRRLLSLMSLIQPISKFSTSKIYL